MTLYDYDKGRSIFSTSNLGKPAIYRPQQATGDLDLQDRNHQDSRFGFCLSFSQTEFVDVSRGIYVQTEQVHRRACLYLKCMCIYIYLESYIHILPILFLRCGKGTSFSKLSWREAVHPNVCCVLQYLLHGYWIPSLVKL